MSTTTATRISPAFDDIDAVLAVIRSAGPYWPLVNYAGNDAEMAALGSRPPTFVPPWFRQDFGASGQPLVDGAEVIIDNSRFVDAAHAVYGADCIVRPSNAYVNIMGPTPFPFIPHLDVPAFRGFTRADQPIWLLKLMKNADLFEHWRIKIATAVSWIYAGHRRRLPLLARRRRGARVCRVTALPQCERRGRQREHLPRRCTPGGTRRRDARGREQPQSPRTRRRAMGHPRR